MRSDLTKKTMRYGIGLSILLHLLLLFSFVFIYYLSPQTPQEKPPQEYVPRYVPSYTVPKQAYSGAIKPSKQLTKTESKKPVDSPPVDVSKRDKPEPNDHPSKQQPPTSLITQSPQTEKSVVTVKKTKPPKSMLAASFASLEQDQYKAITRQKSEEPILLIGDDTQVADPLIKLMGRSLSTYFAYPRTEGMFGLKGRVVVEITLHPEGFYSNVQILQSSSNDAFDSAALYAVNKAPQVIGADRFIDKPKRFVIGFIFD